MQKDLRTLLGRKRLKRLKRPPAQEVALLAHLLRRHQAPRRPRCAAAARCWCPRWSQAIPRLPPQLYGGDEICESQPGLGPTDPRRKAGDQFCFDSIWMRALGAAQQPVIHWINRPTFQQAVEIQGRAPR